MNRPKILSAFFLLSLILSTAACAHLEPPADLLSAREYFRKSTELNGEELTPREYFAAKMALKQAEETWKKDDYDDIIAHDNFMARVRTETAFLLVQAKQQPSPNIMEGLLPTANESSYQVQQSANGLVFSFSQVLFETARSELKPGAKKNLSQVAQFLQNYPDRKIVIEGHTDSMGANAYNRLLSQQRAESVKAHLSSMGIPRQNITAQGMGEIYPVTSNRTEAGRQQNRRVDLVILISEKTN